MKKIPIPNPLSPNYQLTDFHVHTIYSPDSLTTPEKLLAACRRKGMDRIIITDHNTIRGAQEAQALDPKMVIVGEEIMTTEGEILAAFVQEEIPAGLTPAETIVRLNDQGAFISISHPFDIRRKGHWRAENLLEIVPQIDAIETFNARCTLPRFNRQAQQFAQQHNLSGTYGSDAHAAFEIGRGALYLPIFNDANSLRGALPQAISAPLRLSSPMVYLFSRYAVWAKKRSGSKFPD